MEPIGTSTKVTGFVGNVLVTVNPPQVWSDAEPETLSYQRAAVEDEVASTEVVMEGWAVAVIVADKQGLT